MPSRAKPNEYVYQQRRHRLPFGKTPACIYFHYIGPIIDGHRKIRRYYYTDGDRLIGRDEVGELVRLLAANARKPDDEQDPQPDGFSVQGMKWYRISYIAFAIDDDFDFERGNAIEFDDEGAKNHSFFDGWDFDVYIGGRSRSAFCCVNHMKRNQTGGELGHAGEASEYFHFVLHTVPPQETVEYWRFPDSGGTNMGPPVPPP